MLFKLFLESYIKKIILRLFMVIKLSRRYKKIYFRDAPKLRRGDVEWLKREFEKLGWGKWQD